MISYSLVRHNYCAAERYIHFSVFGAKTKGVPLTSQEEKKFRTDNTFIASHINYLINRETRVDNKTLLKSLLDRLD